MTWLSRLLPQSPRLPRLADHNHRTRQAQRRRRQSTLEALEGRTLLSNVVTSITVAANGQRTLAILGDTGNDTFTVTDNKATGQVTVSVPATGRTTVNNSHSPYTTSQAISEVAITLPGNHNSTDNVTITSTGTGTQPLANVSIVAPGVTTPGVAGLDLTLTVTNLTLTGELSVWDAPTFTPTYAPSPTLPIVPTASYGTTAANAPTTAQIPGYNPGKAPWLATVPASPTSGSPTALTLNNNLGGILTMSVTGSHLGTLYVEQDGCCPANVALTGDTISGSVTVEEGVSNGDTITWNNTTAGATTLIQGYGPTMPGCDGSGDLISVQDSGTATTGIFDLAITQLGHGDLTKPEIIDVGNVSEVEVALAGFGIEATQGDTTSPGAPATATKPAVPGNVIDIESITTYILHASSSPFGLYGPPSIVTVQGDGPSDSTTIDNAVIPGNISVTQGNGNNDSVNLEADSAGYTAAKVPGGVLIPHYGTVTISQGTGSDDTILLSSTGSEGNALNTFNNLFIEQNDQAGNSSGDTVTVDSTVVTCYIIVVQGNADGDQVYITASTAGYTTPGPFGSLIDHGGLLAIIQGDGYEDSINITSLGLESPPDFGSVFNDVLIIQGASLVPNSVVCTQATGDTVAIDETTINDNLVILQNVAFTLRPRADLATTLGSVVSDTPVITDGPGLGNNIVSIGTGTAVDSAGAVTGAATNSLGFGVYVGEETYIFQGGAVNTVNLGGAGIGPGLDFSTGFLDIWTGAGGGGFVSADNTAVAYGSFFGFDYVINGGGTGNTYSDSGGNSINGNPGTLPYNNATYTS